MTLQRKTPLRRSGSLKSKTRIKPTNPARRAKAFNRNFGTRGEPVRAMPCLCVPQLEAWISEGCPESPEAPRPCWGDMEAAHIDGARQMGGWGPGTRRKIGPLCHGHAQEAGERRGSQREAFEKRYGLDLQAEAKRIAELLDEQGHA